MTNYCEITRKIEFDAGHRIQNHKSKCRNLHGHRYVLEATVRGPIKDIDGQSDNGMVVDFGDVKRCMMELIHDEWDHGFLVCEDDSEVLEALQRIDHGNHKTVILHFVPTVENLVRWCYNELYIPLLPLQLVRCRLYETPNCWADYPPTDHEIKMLVEAAKKESDEER